MYSLDQTLQPSIGNVSYSYMRMYAYDDRPLGETVVPGRLNFYHSG